MNHYNINSIGFGTVCSDKILFIYLKYELEASEGLLGFTVLFSIIFEILIFQYAEDLLKGL